MASTPDRSQIKKTELMFFVSWLTLYMGTSLTLCLIDAVYSKSIKNGAPFFLQDKCQVKSKLSHMNIHAQKNKLEENPVSLPGSLVSPHTSYNNRRGICRNRKWLQWHNRFFRALYSLDVVMPGVACVPLLSCPFCLVSLPYWQSFSVVCAYMLV